MIKKCKSQQFIRLISSTNVKYATKVVARKIALRVTVTVTIIKLLNIDFNVYYNNYDHILTVPLVALLHRGKNDPL